MQQLSYQLGDSPTTEYPSGVDQMLAALVQAVNDTHCGHRRGVLLCRGCSTAVRALSYRVVGTEQRGIGDAELKRIYLLLGVEEIERVLAHDGDPSPRATCLHLRRWLAGHPISHDDLRACCPPDWPAYAPGERNTASAAAAVLAFQAADEAVTARQVAVSVAATVAIFATLAVPHKGQASSREITSQCRRAWLQQAHRLVDRFTDLLRRRPSYGPTVVGEPRLQAELEQATREAPAAVEVTFPLQQRQLTVTTIKPEPSDVVGEVAHQQEVPTSAPMQVSRPTSRPKSDRLATGSAA